MKIIARLLLATTLLVSAAIGTASAQSPDDEASPATEEETLTARFGMTNEIDSLNPFKLLELPSYEVMGLNYNLLVEFSPEDFSPAPGLADSWETSDDGLEWTFNLNADANWQDGEPVTSEDVKYTFERIIDEKQGLFIDYVRQIDEIETPDEKTVVITTGEPSVQMLSLYVPILPKHVWEEVPEDETKSFENEPAIGSGPFQAVEWRQGQFVRMEANGDYFKGAPEVDELIFQFYNNPDTMVQALRQGEVDYIYNPPVNLFKSLEGEENIETISAPDAGFTELGFNVYEVSDEAVEEFDAPETSSGHEALLDVRVRQAINWAIDEEALTERILQGEGVPGSVLVPPMLESYSLDLEESEVMGFDIDRAKELLTEAGWEDSNDDGVVEKDGEDLRLRLFARSEDSDSVTAAQLITEWLGEAGIKVNTKALSDNALTDTIYEADFDMFIWGWGSDPDPDFILSILDCGQMMGWSDTFYCNEDFSRMYQEQKTQLDLEERAETIKEMQRIVYEEVPYVIFYYDNQFEAYRTDRFEGWTPLPHEADVGQIAFTFSTDNYTELRPVGSGDEGSATGATEEEEDGTSPIVWVLIVLAIVAVFGGFVGMRRRSSEGDRA